MDLSRVKLRPTTTRVAPTVSAPVVCASSADYARLMQETYLEKYLAPLQEETFATRLVPLSVPCCAALREAHEHPDAPWPPLLVELADAVELARGQWPTLFVRLSSRSPKDAALTQPQFTALLRRHCTPGMDLNAKLLALYSASTQAMACGSGREAVALLVRSSRIQDDLRSAVEGAAPLNVCCRQFVAFLPELEIRAFVWEGKLTCMTQYNHLVYSVALVRNRALVQASVEQLFERIRARVDLRNYAIDIVVIGAGERPFEELRAWVVEINPLAEFTGFGLFDFAVDRDIITGKLPFQFRVAETAPVVTRGDMSPEYVQLLDGFDWSGGGGGAQ